MEAASGRTETQTPRGRLPAAGPTPASRSRFTPLTLASPRPERTSGKQVRPWASRTAQIGLLPGDATKTAVCGPARRVPARTRQSRPTRNTSAAKQTRSTARARHTLQYEDWQNPALSRLYGGIPRPGCPWATLQPRAGLQLKPARRGWLGQKRCSISSRHPPWLHAPDAPPVRARTSRGRPRVRMKE